MSDESKEFTVRLSKAAKEFNVAVSTIQEFLTKKGFQVDSSPNTKLTKEMYDLVVKEYQGEKEVKNEAKKLGNLSYKGGSVSVESALQSSKEDEEEDFGDDVFIRTNTITSSKKTVKPVEEVPAAEPVEEKPVVEAPKPVEEKTAVQEPKEEPVKEEKVEEKQQPKPEAKEDNPEPKAEPASDSPFKVVGKIDLDSLNTKTHPDKKHKDQGKKKRISRSNSSRSNNSQSRSNSRSLKSLRISRSQSLNNRKSLSQNLSRSRRQRLNRKSLRLRSRNWKARRFWIRSNCLSSLSVQKAVSLVMERKRSASA